MGDRPIDSAIGDGGEILLLVERPLGSSLGSIWIIEMFVAKSMIVKLE